MAQIILIALILTMISLVSVSGNSFANQRIKVTSGHSNHHQTRVNLTELLDLCEICWCNKKDSLACQKDHQITSFPILSNETKRAAIKEIIIENQGDFTRLSNKDLSLYPSITSLTIMNCGLTVIEENAFQSNEKLERIDLRSNKLQVLPWKLFHQPTLPTIIITGNPLSCNCSNKWIQLNMLEGGQNLGPYWDQITCIHPNGSTENLLQVQIPDCDLPKVTVDPKRIIINESESLSITCNVTGSPSPKVFWSIDDSFSRIGKSFKKSQLILASPSDSEFSNSSIIFDIGPDSLIWVKNPRELNVLTIENIMGPDVGLVKCIGENMVGRVQDEASIKIRGKPRIESLEPINKFHLCLNYRVTGVPKLRRIWLFNGKPLKLSSDIRDLETLRSTKNPHLMQGCLEIEPTGKKILGNYTLIAINAYGSTNRTITVDEHTAGLPQLEPGIVPPKGMQLRVNLSIPEQERMLKGMRNNSSNGNFHSVRKIVILIGSLGGMLILSSIIILSIIHRKNDRINKQGDLGISIREKIPLNESKMIRNPNYSPVKDSFHSDSGLRLIPRSRINFLRELGEGAFGRVILGTVGELKSDEDSTLAAVKTLKDSSDPEVRKDFEREAEVLSTLCHPNIVEFYGISIDGDPMMMIIEYMKFGDLNNYLRAKDPSNNLIKMIGDLDDSHSKLCFNDLLRISIQIASGLEYLSLQHFVHRDLATRNCLVGDNLRVKIGDFGMSRDLYATDYYKIGRQTMLPIRWMSPESIIYRKFTVQSDIWSFGVVLWEIFTYGKQPFYELSNQEVIKEVVEGKYLAQPEDCPNAIYDLMQVCWIESSFKRITASEVLAKLVELELDKEEKLDIDSHIMR